MGISCSFVAVSAPLLDELRDDDEKLANYIYHPTGDNLDIDKAWHGIHYLLTGETYGGAEPASLAVLGGTEFGADLGMGPARLLTPEQVKQVATALAATATESLATRYDPAAMEGLQIYPDMWVRDGEAALDYLLDYYQQLVVFYRDAAARDDAVIQSMG